jgi:hypothetical protein
MRTPLEYSWTAFGDQQKCFHAFHEIHLHDTAFFCVIAVRKMPVALNALRLISTPEAARIQSCEDRERRHHVVLDPSTAGSLVAIQREGTTFFLQLEHSVMVKVAWGSAWIRNLGLLGQSLSKRHPVIQGNNVF